MGKKKRSHPDLEEVLARPWCYYCERDFDDLKILISHQKAKHFKCNRCGRRLNTAGGLSVHMNQVHKEQLEVVENAQPMRENLDYEIFGMEGIPADVLQTHNQKVMQQFHEAQANRQAVTGNPLPGSQPGAASAVKKPKFESPADLKKRLAEHRAKKAAGELTDESTPAGTPTASVGSQQTSRDGSNTVGADSQTSYPNAYGQMYTTPAAYDSPAPLPTPHQPADPMMGPRPGHYAQAGYGGSIAYPTGDRYGGPGPSFAPGPFNHPVPIGMGPPPGLPAMPNSAGRPVGGLFPGQFHESSRAGAGLPARPMGGFVGGPLGGFPPGKPSGLPPRMPSGSSSGLPSQVPGLPQRPQYGGSSMPGPGRPDGIPTRPAISESTAASVDALIASVAGTSEKPAAPSEPAAPKTSGKKDKGKDRPIRLVYSDNEVSPEEKMASWTRFASSICYSFHV